MISKRQKDKKNRNCASASVDMPIESVLLSRFAAFHGILRPIGVESHTASLTIKFNDR
jgi:hypothetical protein